MALALIVDSLESVPEALRGEYVADGDKFKLSVEGLEDTNGLKSALKKERERADANEKQVKAWKALGKDSTEIAELLKKQADAEAEAARKAGNFDAILKQHRDGWEKEKGTLETELQAARASERSAIIETSVMGALTKQKVTSEGVELLTERLGKRIHFETVDGKRVIQIMQADGKTPMAGSGADGSATFDDLVKEAVKTYPSLFEGTGAGGGGKPPKDGAGGTGKTITRSEFDALGPLAAAAKIKEGFKVVD